MAQEGAIGGGGQGYTPMTIPWAQLIAALVSILLDIWKDSREGRKEQASAKAQRFLAAQKAARSGDVSAWNRAVTGVPDDGTAAALSDQGH